MVSTPAGAAVRLRRLPHGSDALAAGKRLYFLDNLRVGLVMLVIAHHVGQAYGPTGGAWPIMETARSALLGPFFTVNRSFFMSLFFMISGYFTVMSFEASGAQRLREEPPAAAGPAGAGLGPAGGDSVPGLCRRSPRRGRSTWATCGLSSTC